MPPNLPELRRTPDDPWLSTRMHHSAAIGQQELALIDAFSAAMATALSRLRALSMPSDTSRPQVPDPALAGAAFREALTDFVSPISGPTWWDRYGQDYVDSVLPTITANLQGVLQQAAADPSITVEQERAAALAVLYLAGGEAAGVTITAADTPSPAEWSRVWAKAWSAWTTVAQLNEAGAVARGHRRVAEALQAQADATGDPDAKARLVALVKQRLADAVRANPPEGRLNTALDRFNKVTSRLGPAPFPGAPQKPLSQAVEGQRNYYNQAQRMARSASVSTYNLKALERAHLDSQVNGIALKKTWLATVDKRTRKDHAHADGQSVPLADKFNVGGARLDYPGDPDGPDDQVINCRCTFIVEPDPEAPALTVVPNAPDYTHGLPKLSKAQTFAQSAADGGANPLGFRNEDIRLRAQANTHLEEVRNNCHQVVGAMELRARGLDVAARFTAFLKEGRFAFSIAEDWEDPATGQARHFTHNPSETGYKKFLKDATKDWAVGARGFVNGAWKHGGGAHIFNVEKTEDGLRFYEGQVSGNDAEAYLARMKPSSIALLRVDDLQPRDRILKAVQPAADATKEVTAADRLESMRVRVAQMEVDLATAQARYRDQSVPQRDRNIALAYMYAYQRDLTTLRSQMSQFAASEGMTASAYSSTDLQRSPGPGQAHPGASPPRRAAAGRGAGGRDGLPDQLRQRHPAGGQSAGLRPQGHRPGLDREHGLRAGQGRPHEADNAVTSAQQLLAKGRAVSEEYPMTQPTEQQVDVELPTGFRGVLAPLDTTSGDGREIATPAGELRLRAAPIPFSWQKMSDEEHLSSYLVGRIDRAWIENGMLMGEGTYDLGSEEGREAARLLGEGFASRVSVDLDDVQVDFRPEDSADDSLEDLFMPEGTLVMTDWRLAGATQVVISAFDEAIVQPVYASDAAGANAPLDASEPAMSLSFALETMAASGVPVVGDTVTLYDPEATDTELTGVVASVDDTEDGVMVTVSVPADDGVSDPRLVTVPLEGVELAEPGDDMALVAAAVAPLAPPREWFEDPKFGIGGEDPRLVPLLGQSGAYGAPLQITDDGRVFGHLATWGTCHTGLPGCTTPPSSRSNYGAFLLGETVTDKGRIATGTLTYDTGHADISLDARSAVRHYDHTGTAFAHVRIGEDAHGIWVAGALLPDVPPEKLPRIRGSKLSGDWRGGELRAALATNTPGFPVMRARAQDLNTEPLALVASGVVHPLAERKAPRDRKSVV